MKTLIIDNFDSFTYNLFQYVAELGGNPVVFRNDAINIAEIEKGHYTHIMLSPGPGSPENRKDFGVCAEVINVFAGRIPILGVCLGHQGIIQQLGGKIVRAPEPVHGKQSEMKIDPTSPLFKGLPPLITAMRYHSLIGRKEDLPADLQIIARTTKDDLIMAVAHKRMPLFGVQFHPESIGTAHGKIILKNFLAIKIDHIGSVEAEKSLSMEGAARGFKKVGAHLTHTEKLSGRGLTEFKKIIEAMIAGKQSEAEMARFLKDLAERGETAEEITALVQIMQKHMVEVPVHSHELMDTCGTGGSGLMRMNISTTAAFVLAACGVKIAKHGNKAASGRCGSFDLLENLGINIQLGPREIADTIQKLGIGFLYAPLFHPVMKVFMPVRKKLGIRTIFNLIGPLINPAQPAYHLLGTNNVETAEKLAEVMQRLHYQRAMVVVGEDGLDEVTIAGKTTCFELKNGKVRRFEFSPEEAGMRCVKNLKKSAKLKCGTIAKNSQLFLQLLKGRVRSQSPLAFKEGHSLELVSDKQPFGPPGRAPQALQHLLLLNCGFALMIRGFAKDVKSGIAMARKTIESGKALQKFEDYKKLAASFTAGQLS